MDSPETHTHNTHTRENKAYILTHNTGLKTSIPNRVSKYQHCWVFHSPLLHFPLFHDVYVTFSEKAMAPHSSTLVWKIPWTEEPGGLQSMGSWRVGHHWETSLSLFTFMHWRRKCQATPVFLPGESQGWGSLVDCHLWGRTELDMT